MFERVVASVGRLLSCRGKGLKDLHISPGVATCFIALCFLVLDGVPAAVTEESDMNAVEVRDLMQNDTDYYYYYYYYDYGNGSFYYDYDYTPDDGGDGGDGAPDSDFGGIIDLITASVAATVAFAALILVCGIMMPLWLYCKAKERDADLPFEYQYMKSEMAVIWCIVCLTFGCPGSLAMYIFVSAEIGRRKIMLNNPGPKGVGLPVSATVLANSAANGQNQAVEVKTTFEGVPNSSL